MFSSTIIPTIGRQSLYKSINSVINQSFCEDDIEVIVVNDSGKPLLLDHKYDPKHVKQINTNRRGLSIARNTAAAIAKGRYLHFLDDDDWLLPNAVDKFWHLTKEYSNVAWFYGTVEFQDGEGRPLGKINLRSEGNCSIQALAGSWIPVQGSLIDRNAFFRVGGFAPTFPVAQETDLLRKITLHGDLAYTTHSVACMLRGELWNSTTMYEAAPSYNRVSRELMLSEASAFSRLLRSAKSPYWFGRISRAYLTSILWNLYRRKLFVALSRSLYFLASLIPTNWRAVTPSFWQGMTNSQVPNTHARILES